MGNNKVKQIQDYINQENQRQNEFIQLIASENLPSLNVANSLQNILLNYKTVEGYLGKRYHSGCNIVDEIERLAIIYAKSLFSAKHVNVQTNSATIANQSAITALASSNEASILSMDIKCGGHISHSVRYPNTFHYEVDRNTGLLDYEEIRKIAKKYNPDIIIAGSSSYPREINFTEFRKIADEVDAFLIADIAHIAGLVAAGYHNSPVNSAHITTASSYKTLRGPRSGFILLGDDYELAVNKNALWKQIDRSVFPLNQGSTNVLDVAAKAVCFSESDSQEFKSYMNLLLENSKFIAKCFLERGYKVLTNGTSNHITLIDITPKGMTGKIAETVLEEVGISLNKNQIPFDKYPPLVSSGIRIGSQFITSRGMMQDEIEIIVDLIDKTLNRIKPINEINYTKNEEELNQIRRNIKELSLKFPIDLYN